MYRRAVPPVSLLELTYFYVLEWALEVIDIREQYPLFPQEETLDIARECGVRHPTDPKSKHPIVMTTDFRITVLQEGAERDYVRTVKYAKDLHSKRTMEKLEIERRFFLRMNVSWALVTDKDLPKTLAKNVEWLHPFRNASDFTDLSEGDIHQIAVALTERIIEQKRPLRHITSECDDRLGLEAGTSLSVVRHLLANRYWQTDMNKPLNPCERLTITVPPSV